MNNDTAILKKVIRKNWSPKGTPKSNRYVGKFSSTTRLNTKISGKVLGNHGTYTVSIVITENSLSSACSCYIGKHGGCHHCQALGITYLKTPEIFKELKQRTLRRVKTLEHLPEFLRSVTLEELIKDLKKQGITQKAFAESIDMSSQKLSAIKSSEKRNRNFHELGAVKLACLWTLEKFKEK